MYLPDDTPDLLQREVGRLDLLHGGLFAALACAAHRNILTLSEIFHGYAPGAEAASCTAAARVRMVRSSMVWRMVRTGGAQLTR